MLYWIIFLFPLTLFATSPQGGRPTILILGDSLVEGYGVKKSEAFPALLQQKLKSTHNVVSSGVGGATSASALPRLKWLLKSHPQAKSLVLVLGGNDGLRGLAPASMKNHLAAAISLAKQKSIKVVLAGMKAPPNYGKEYGTAFEKVFVELAAEHSIKLIPFILEGVAGERHLNIEDGIHPNVQGHKILLKTVAEALAKL